jgi:hypothetical protein
MPDGLNLLPKWMFSLLGLDYADYKRRYKIIRYRTKVYRQKGKKR